MSSHELVNLLPESFSKTFRRRYFFRLGTVVLLFISALVILHGVFLVPTYIYMSEDAKAHAMELKQLSNNQETAEEQQVGQLQKSLQGETAYLLTFKDTATVSGLIRSVLAVPRPGIVLTGFNYAAPTKTQQGSFEIQGVASTREALRSYDTALSALPYVTNANLPISDYANASDIQFTITLTGSLKP